MAAIASVYHASKPTFGFGEHPEWPNQFVLAATVLTNKLEWAFHQTQNLTRPWPENEDVIASKDGSRRSTSVGDVVVIDGVAWRCEMAGWTEIED